MLMSMLMANLHTFVCLWRAYERSYIGILIRTPGICTNILYYAHDYAYGQTALFSCAYGVLMKHPM
jgi:hypothetical protein